MQFQDRGSIERVRRLGDGRIAAVARFARSGVYDYAGHEVGRPDLQTVKVYRPEEEVFSEDAMNSFAHKAITLDHSSEQVTAPNWKKVAIGHTEGRMACDGGFVEIPLMLADASAVQAVESGAAKELSAGYSCQLVWGDGVTPDGQPYQAKQVGNAGNGGLSDCDQANSTLRATLTPIRGSMQAGQPNSPERTRFCRATARS